MLLLSTSVIVFAVLGEASTKKKASEFKEKNLANGFGDDIEWVRWDDAITKAKTRNKPIFLLVHKSWCGACQALKTAFSHSTSRHELVMISKEFIMVNTEDDDEPEDEEYAPDGRYIPRTFFLDTNGKRIEVDNKKMYPSNKHYFSQIPDLIKGMKKALELFQGEDKDSSITENGEMKRQKDDEVKGSKKEDDEEAAGCPRAAKARKAEKELEEKAKKMGEDKATEKQHQSDEAEEEQKEAESAEKQENMKKVEKRAKRDKDVKQEL